MYSHQAETMNISFPATDRRVIPSESPTQVLGTFITKQVSCNPNKILYPRLLSTSKHLLPYHWCSYIPHYAYLHLSSLILSLSASNCSRHCGLFNLLLRRFNLLLPLCDVRSTSNHRISILKPDLPYLAIT